MKKMKIKQKIKSEIITADKTGRRNFLSTLWKILGLVAFAELAFFTVSMLRPGRKNLKDNALPNFKVAGNVDEFTVNSVTADRVNKYYLIRMGDGGFMALSLTCSHLGCSVLWDSAKNQFLCPCHSSAFDNLGIVLNSPAPRPLDYYPVTIESGKVIVDLARKKHRKKFDKTQVTYAI